MMTVLIRSDVVITDPPPNRPRIPVGNPILTSDNISDTSELVGTITDCAYGGTPQPWLGPTGQFGASGGAVIRTGSLDSVLALAVGHGDMFLSAAFTAAPVGGQVNVDVRRASRSAIAECYRMKVSTTGTVRLFRVKGSTETALGAITHTLTVGARIGIRVWEQGDTDIVQYLKAGDVIEQVIVPSANRVLPGASIYAGIFQGGTGTATGFANPILQGIYDPAAL